jgi:hypothetical protein
MVTTQAKSISSPWKLPHYPFLMATLRKLLLS